MKMLNKYKDYIQLTEIQCNLKIGCLRNKTRDELYGYIIVLGLIVAFAIWLGTVGDKHQWAATYIIVMAVTFLAFILPHQWSYMKDAYEVIPKKNAKEINDMCKDSEEVDEYRLAVIANGCQLRMFDYYAMKSQIALEKDASQAEFCKKIHGV